MQVACVGERLVPAIGVLLLGIAGPLEVRERVRVGRRHPPRITPGENERTNFVNFVLVPASTPYSASSQPQQTDSASDARGWLDLEGAAGAHKSQLLLILIYYSH